MSEVKWIKLSVEILDDKKMQLIDSMPERDAIFRIWIGLLSMAGQTNDNGMIYLSEDMPYTNEMLSTIFNRDINIVRLALDCLCKFGMISIHENNIVYINNWEKHQNIEGLDKIREQRRLRQQRYRENQKLLLDNKSKNKKESKRKSVTTTLCNVTKTKYLDCIMLSDEEYNKLVDLMTKELADSYIERINNYVMSKGDKYKSHYHTIRNWYNKDIANKPKSEVQYKEVKLDA